MQEIQGSQACTASSGGTSTEARTAPDAGSDKRPNRAERRNQRRKGHFTTRQQHLKVLVGLHAGTGETHAYYGPAMGPEQVIYCVPDRGPAQRGPVGLSPVSNSQGIDPHDVSIEDASKAAFGRRPARNGLKGPSKRALRDIKRTFKCTSDFSRRCGFVTYSLLDADYEDLKRMGTLSVLQRRIIDRWAQYQKKHDQPALAIQVVEIGEKRYKRTDSPMPHFHLVVYGWGLRKKDGAFLLNKEINEEILAKACQDAGLPSRERPAACQIQGVKYDAGSYLSKYLTKGPPKGMETFPEEHHDLIPRQWWNRSADLKRFVDGHLINFPPDFCAFIVMERQRLERMGLGNAFIVEGSTYQYFGETRRYEITAFRFNSPEHTAAAWEAYLAWRSSPNEWGREADRWLDERHDSGDNSTTVPLPNLHPTNYRHSFLLDEWFDLSS